MNNQGRFGVIARRWFLRVAVAATLACGASASAQTGEEPKAETGALGETPADLPPSLDAPKKSKMSWWAVPRPARVAAKKLAADQDASITRCVAIEQGDKVTYEIHATHKLGLFKRDDFVLTGVSEPAIDAEKRKEERTLRRWWQRKLDGPTEMQLQEQRALNSGQTTPGSRRRFFGLFDRSR